MAKRAEALIKGELLVWGRESAGMGSGEAADHLGVSEERLKSWESGASRPTVIQLRKAANVYKQSFAAFFLPKPPEVFRSPLRDFRRLPDEVFGGVSSALSIDVRQAMDRRDVCLELYAEMKEKTKPFSASTTLRKNPEQVGHEAHSLLGIGFKEQRAWSDGRVAFNNWREAVERQGVLVFQSTGVPLSEMRGYSVAKLPLPVIVVNRKDT